MRELSPNPTGTSGAVTPTVRGVPLGTLTVAGTGAVLVATYQVRQHRVPALAEELQSLARDLPGYVDALVGRAGAAGDAVAGAQVSEQLEEWLAQLPGQLGGSFGALLGATKSALALVAGRGIVLVLTVYLVSGLPRLRSLARGQLHRASGGRAVARLDRAIEAVAPIMTGRLLVSAIAGLSAFVVLSLLGIPYAAALALLIAVADMVPLVGATLGALVASRRCGSGRRRPSQSVRKSHESVAPRSEGS